MLQKFIDWFKPLPPAAEKITDQICEKLNVKESCRTAEESIVPEVSDTDKESAKKFFPSYGVNLAADRLGAERFAKVVERLEKNPESRELVCECENVTAAETEEILQDESTFTINDLRRRTRMGMGTCQGTFCALRGAALFAKKNPAENSLETAEKFLRERWKGIRPVLFGRTLREAVMTRELYEMSLNLKGGGAK